MIRFLAEDEASTQELARLLGSVVVTGDAIVLSGELGAGKTTFTKGIAKGLAIPQLIKSPTYTLVREYRTGRLPLFHMDVYRLDDAASDDLGLEEYYEQTGVTVIEWGHILAAAELPESYLDITLAYEQDVQARTITIEAIGEAASALLDRFAALLAQKPYYQAD